MKFNWKRALVIAFDLLVAVYLLLAVTAFNKPDDTVKVCSEVKIDISDDIIDGFLNADEIKSFLQRKNLYPLGKPIQDINIRKIEETLQHSPFVDRVQCYKTYNGQVHITLTQRMPLIRVKAENGEDYYIDNHGGIMPNTKYTTDLIIATGNIDRRYARKVLTPMGNHIIKDKFWQNQIVQLNVLPDSSVEIVPRVGEHIIYLGQPHHVSKKLKRLEKFYKYGLNRIGWNKYSYISLEFDNQIICKKK